MATIKEMAENMCYPTLAEKAACWDGANAVLEEIESVLKEDECNDRPWLLKGERLYNKLATKIKELKGE